MTGTTRSSADLPLRQRKALYRAWHRGTREMDLILGGFADGEISTMDDTELGEFELLLDQPDTEFMKWLTGELDVPPSLDTGLFRRIKAFRPMSTN